MKRKNTCTVNSKKEQKCDFKRGCLGGGEIEAMGMKLGELWQKFDDLRNEITALHSRLFETELKFQELKRKSLEAEEEMNKK